MADVNGAPARRSSRRPESGDPTTDPTGDPVPPDGQRGRRATITDVAERAGVSKSTVSHVINDTRFVAGATRAQVLRAIEELNYRPSQVARSLSVQQTRTVGLLISDIGNPFYHEIVEGVEDMALARGYSVYLFNANYDLERSLRYLRSMAERRADGVLLMSSRMSDELLEVLRADGIPAVVLDWHDVEAAGVGTITFDFAQGVQQAVEHLFELGHRRFAHVSGDRELWTAQVRERLFLDALAERGIAPDGVPVVEGNFHIDGGRMALRRLLALPQRPTAIFTVNDLTAIGIAFEAQALGVAVPERLSVIGVDDIALAAEITPALSTVALPRYDIGRWAMEMLLELLERPADAPPARVVHPQLIVRGSTAAPSASAAGERAEEE